jgi:hypothetical protein
MSVMSIRKTYQHSCYQTAQHSQSVLFNVQKKEKKWICALCFLSCDFSETSTCYFESLLILLLWFVTDDDCQRSKIDRTEREQNRYRIKNRCIGCSIH